MAAKLTRSGILLRLSDSAEHWDSSDDAARESDSEFFEVSVEFEVFFLSSDEVDDFFDALIGDS